MSHPSHAARESNPGYSYLNSDALTTELRPPPCYIIMLHCMPQMSLFCFDASCEGIRDGIQLKENDILENQCLNASLQLDKG